MEEVSIALVFVYYLIEQFAHLVTIGMYHGNVRFSFATTQFVEIAGKVLSFVQNRLEYLCYILLSGINLVALTSRGLRYILVRLISFFAKFARWESRSDAGANDG